MKFESPAGILELIKALPNDPREVVAAIMATDVAKALKLEGPGPFDFFGIKVVVTAYAPHGYYRLFTRAEWDELNNPIRFSLGGES